MQKRMLDAAAAIPGVTAVGYADRLPLSIGGGDSDVYSDTTTDYRPTNAAADAQNFQVSPDYFRAAGTAILAGRAFTMHDDEKAPDGRRRESRVCTQGLWVRRQGSWSTFQVLGRQASRSDRRGGGRQVPDPDRRSEAGHVLFLPPAPRQRHLDHRSIGARSAGDRRCAASLDAQSRSSAAARDQNLEQRIGFGPLRRPRRHGGFRSAGPAGRDACHHRHLRHGCIYGQQTPPRVRHPDRTWRKSAQRCSAQRSGVLSGCSLSVLQPA